MILVSKVNESFPFTIALSWKGAAQDAQNGTADNQQSTIVFPKGNSIPSVKALTFYRSGTFAVDVHYADVTELQAPAKISTYTVRMCFRFFWTAALDDSDRILLFEISI